MMKRPVRVLQVVGSQVGGIRLHVHDVLLGLDPLSVQQSYVYSTRLFDRRFADELPQITARCATVRGLDVARPPALSDLRNLLRVLAVARGVRADVVHGHGAKGGLYARIAGRLAGARTVYTPHGGTAHAAYGRLADRLYRRVERLLLRWTDRFVFESAWSCDAFERRIGRTDLPALVNPNGHALADALDVPEPAPPGTGRIGFFGMLRDEKGPDLAVAALALLREQGRSATLHVHGDGPARAALEAQAVPLGDAVTFHGDVPDALDRMRGCDVIVVPSRHEAFGYTALEASLLGVPVVAASVGGLPELLQDAPRARLVPPGDVPALAAELARVLDAPPAAGSTAALRARFSRGRMLTALADLYRELCPDEATVTAL